VIHSLRLITLVVSRKSPKKTLVKKIVVASNVGQNLEVFIKRLPDLLLKAIPNPEKPILNAGLKFPKQGPHLALSVKAWPLGFSVSSVDKDQIPIQDHGSVLDRL